MVKIKDSVFLVTGGATGLGGATSRLLLAEGAHVTIFTRSDHDQSEFPGVLFIKGDVRSESDVKGALEATVQKFGKLDGVMHCAGVFQSGDELFNMETQQPGDYKVLTDIVTINLLGTFNVNRLAVPYFLPNQPDEEGQKGIIINCSSTSGHSPMTSAVAYSTSKAAIISLSYPFAKQLSTLGIRVMDIAPALCDTPMFRRAVGFNQDIANLRNLFPSRLIEPVEYANAVKHIIETPMLNGSSYQLDGALRP